MKIIPFRIFFLIFNFFAGNIYSQFLNVSSSQLSFGNVYENAPDSLQLTLTNTLGRDVTVTGIKFYNTYGAPAFSTPYTWFSIADGASASIWIKFSPRHNIYHNTEMVIENDGLRGCVNVDLTGQGKYSDTYYNSTENLSEENLKLSINQLTGNGYVSLGYNVARDSMFMLIDNKKTNGQGASQNTLECIYTGRLAVGYTDRADCQTNYSFNTEHTFPQSLFSSMEPMRSDLHHLFPTDDAANSERADNPFNVVSTPSWNNGGSKSDGTYFEPRDQQKGPSSRALFYFVLRYQNYNNFLNIQENVLRNWHRTFPPSQAEVLRNLAIFNVQHNKNPFVDYPMFIDRITSVSSNSVAPVLKSIDLTEDTIVYGSINTGIPVIYNYVIVNNGNTDIQFSNFGLTHFPEIKFASTGNDTIIPPGESLVIKIWCQAIVTDSMRAFLSFNTDATGSSFVSVPIFVNDLVYTTIPEVFTDITVSPNPSHDYIKVNYTQRNGKINWMLFDITGKKITSSVLSENGIIELNGIPAGAYILHLENNEGVTNRKIIIQ